ncbi:MAG: hypothetical protein FWG36_02960 [Oscillospiraceae bacterium]|nr:hypothetical protein [Oscillospiraceae bacterium]
MEYIRQTIGGDKLSGIFDIPQSLRGKNAEVIILFSEDHFHESPKQRKRPLGFAKGAEVPDSFFEPLSEEDLQLWGL